MYFLKIKYRLHKFVFGGMLKIFYLCLYIMRLNGKREKGIVREQMYLSLL